MQLRVLKFNFYLLFTFLILLGCKTKINNNDSLIIGSIYQNTPKFISAPPNKLGVIDSTKGIKHRYAINKYLINEKISVAVGDYFYNYKSDELFDKIKLNKEESNLVKKLNDEFPDGKIDSDFLEKYLNEELVFLNKKKIDDLDERNYNISRILTFSRPLYNREMDTAVLYVINYGGGLDSSQVIYIMKKVKEEWQIKYYITVSIS